jgi:branched-chain amino acid transport system permease protein
MDEFLQHWINGLSLGCIYALVALGYTLVFGVLTLINFAHGEMVMLGAYVGMYSARYFGLAQNPSISSLLITLLFSMTICAAMGFIIERFAYRPLRKAPRINLLITAVGVSLFLQFSGQLVFGSAPQFFPEILSFNLDHWKLNELQFNPLQITVLVVAFVLTFILQTIVFRSQWGRAMRAVSFNEDLAKLMGIPTDRVIASTFMVGAALAGAAGVLVGMVYPKIDPLMGSLLGLKSFVAAVVGGIGNMSGAVLGALILGLSEEFVVGYLNPSYRDAIAFAFLILILLVKPSGLLGENRIEKV